MDAKDNHHASVEQLTHFHCARCRMWWSIGDAPERAEWYCPWCGHQAESVPVEEDD